jgi:hypothetical protein
MLITPPCSIQRSTRRSARNNSTAVQAFPSTETAVAPSSLPTEAEAASAVTAEFTESEYTTPARGGASSQETAAAGPEEMASAPAVTRNRGTRVPVSASPSRGKGEGLQSKSKMMASTSATASEAIATSTLSPHSVGAANTVTPPDSIKTVKMMDTPVGAVKIESAAAAAVATVAANNNNDADASDKQEETETSTATDTVMKEQEDSERNKTSAPDDGKANVAAVESPGDGSNIGNNNNGGNKSTRGLVSRRGRFISPGRRLQPAVAAAAAATVHSPPSRNSISNSNNIKTEAVIEYKTFRSPPRKRDEEVPSLCSTGSGQLAGVAETEVKSAVPADAVPKPPASSISCDPSMIDSTSPLASHEQADERKQPASTKNPAAAAGSGSQTPPRKTADTVRLVFVWFCYRVNMFLFLFARHHVCSSLLTFSTLCSDRYSQRNPP